MPSISRKFGLSHGPLDQDVTFVPDFEDGARPLAKVADFGDSYDCGIYFCVLWV